MDNQFKAGDVVVLKSSPVNKMTIETQNADGTYRCIWQDKNKRKYHENYVGILLMYPPAPFVYTHI